MKKIILETFVREEIKKHLFEQQLKNCINEAQVLDVVKKKIKQAGSKAKNLAFVVSLVSALLSAGYTETQAQDVLKKAGYSEDTVSRLFTMDDIEIYGVGLDSLKSSVLSNPNSFILKVQKDSTYKDEVISILQDKSNYDEFYDYIRQQLVRAVFEDGGYYMSKDGTELKSEKDLYDYVERYKKENNGETVPLVSIGRGPKSNPYRLIMKFLVNTQF